MLKRLLFRAKMVIFKPRFINSRNVTYVCSRDDKNIESIRFPINSNDSYDYDNIHIRSGDYVKKDDLLGTLGYSKVSQDLFAPKSGRYFLKKTDRNELVFDFVDSGKDNKYLENKLEYFDYTSSNEFIDNIEPITFDYPLSVKNFYKMYDYGTYLLQKGDQTAMNIFSKIIKVISQHETNDKLYSFLSNGTYKNETAPIDFNQVIISAYYNTAIAYQTNGLLQEALDYYKKSKTYLETLINEQTHKGYRDHMLVITYSSMGSIYYTLSDIQDAINIYKDALYINPDHIKSHYGLAISYYMIGNKDLAKNHFESAIKWTDERNFGHTRIIGHYYDFINNYDIKPDHNMCNSPQLIELCPLSKDICIFKKISSRLRKSNIFLNIYNTNPISNPNTNIHEAKKILINSLENLELVLLTGAGISKQTGLPTRQDLWETYDRDESVNIVTFRKDPTKLWNVVRDFYNRALEKQVDKSDAHEILDKLKQKYYYFCVITQNVDRLHTDSLKNVLEGRSKVIHNHGNVIELHGTLNELMCPTCFKVFDVPSIKHLKGELPECSRGIILKPNVVLFGEMVKHDYIDKAARYIRYNKVLLIIGTASDVSPAVDLIRYAKNNGKIIIEINPQKSKITSIIDYYLQGSADNILKELFVE